ncbi:unnamed protein product [Staurois parvus]|uniref:Uncharacterized protein n=1 Tax=Staurois parvus TaxID=386267 RepID=A0ABN9HQ15_9NEOB|nr:unnamed protein product [Staurois parvus]
MVGVTGQVQQVASSVVQRRVRQRDRNRMQDRYRAQDKHNTKAESVGLAIP